MTVYEAIGELSQFPPDEDVGALIVGQYIKAKDEDGKDTYILELEEESFNINIVCKDKRCILEVEL